MGTGQSGSGSAWPTFRGKLSRVLERYSEVTFVIFDLKNLILTYTKYFPKRIYEFNFSDFEKKDQVAYFCNTLLQVVKNTERLLFFFLLSYLIYSYIQLILLMDEFPLHHKIQRKENIVCQGLDVSGVMQLNSRML